MTPDVTSPRPPASPRTRWRLWLTIAFGLLLPLVFTSALIGVIINSPVPWWGLALGGSLGCGYSILRGAVAAKFPSKNIGTWVGSVAAFLLFYTERLIAHEVSTHPTTFLFTMGYTSAFVVGVIFRTLPFVLPSGRSAAVRP